MKKLFKASLFSLTLLLLTSLFSTIVLAQAAWTIIIKVRVFDNISKAPIAGASVSFVPPGVTRLTDATGSVNETITTTEGRITVSVSASGYISQSRTVSCCFSESRQNFYLEKVPGPPPPPPPGSPPPSPPGSPPPSPPGSPPPSPPGSPPPSPPGSPPPSPPGSPPPGGTCTAAGGTCKPNVCLPSEVDVGARYSCPRGNICCIPANAPNCAAAGGYCTSGCTPRERDLGLMDCPPSISRACCVSIAGGGGPPIDIQGSCPANHIDTAIGCIPTDPTAFAAWFLGWAIGIAGGIAFLLILYGGFRVITSAGNPEQLQGGKELITSAIVGLLVIIFSLFLLRLIGLTIFGLPAFR